MRFEGKKQHSDREQLGGFNLNEWPEKALNQNVQNAEFAIYGVQFS